MGSPTAQTRALRNGKGQQGQNDCGHQRLEIRPPRLPPHLRELLFFFDRFYAVAQFARAARGECDSGPVPPLEKADRGAKEWEEQAEPPQGVQA